MGSTDIDVHWGTHPAGHLHMQFIVAAARKNQAYQNCLKKLIERGVCTEEGRLLQYYKSGQWFKA